jgi:hypothetical protein
MIFQSPIASVPASPQRTFRPPSRARLQRKCACGGAPGPAGECEPCRKQRLQRQAGSLTISESTASEAEADAIAERIVAGNAASPVPGGAGGVRGRGLQRQRRPEDILPNPHVAAAPTMRPEGAEMVRGFAVTGATCGCNKEVAAREKAIEGRIAAYTSCGQRKDLGDPFALDRCVRKKLFGSAGPKVPALGTADPDTSTVRIAEGDALVLREKLLGEPAEGPCVALRTRAMLVHEGEHLEQFDEIARSLGAGFFAEFKGLEGDPKRLEKLRAKFPNETAKYDNAWQRSVSNNVQAETGAYTAERDFYGEVRSAWSEVCGSAVPTPDVGPPQGAPGRQELQRRTSDNEITAQGPVPEVVGEVIGAEGQPLDATTRAFMEERFGHNFGRVRVHADARAAESARAVSAEAYTVGQHIAFASNRYHPSSETGRRLLAHELTHTLQQGEGGLPLRISDPQEETEKEADRSEERTSPSVRNQRRSGTWLARKETAWPPPWHEGALNAIARFAGPSDGKTADGKWPQMQAYLCKLSQEDAGSLLRRWSSLSDKFARYVADKFPANHKDIIAILRDLKEGKSPALCAPAPKVTPPVKQTPAPPKKTPDSKPSDEDESQCEVDVRAIGAGVVGGAVGAKHLFLVVTDKVGNQYGARGGPDVPTGLFALIETDFGRYESGIFPDYDPSALSLTVLKGPEACDKKDCVADACRTITAAEVGYEIEGPNSNSVASELLTACGIPRQKPDVWAPGWDVPMFGPAVSGTGGEEGGRPDGDDTGGGGSHQ